MAKFTIDVTSNIPKVKLAFDQAPQDTVRQVANAIKLIAVRIERTAKPKVPVDTGELRGDVRVREVRELSAKVGTTKKYAVYVHEGTKPHYPPISALTGWARRHGVSPYVVARGIAKKGTKANPFMRDALEETTAYREQVVKRGINTVLSNLETRSK